MADEYFCEHCDCQIDDIGEAYEDDGKYYCCEDCMIAGQDQEFIDS